MAQNGPIKTLPSPHSVVRIHSQECMVQAKQSYYVLHHFFQTDKDTELSPIRITWLKIKLKIK